jgi:hypothetical protein
MRKRYGEVEVSLLAFLACHWWVYPLRKIPDGRGGWGWAQHPVCRLRKREKYLAHGRRIPIPRSSCP